jgi:hypothetical protein
MKTEIIKEDGFDIEITTNEPGKEIKVLSFYDWMAQAIDPSAQAAWNYKQNEIIELINEWNDSVMYGKDKLKDTIDKITKFNTVLKADNKRLREELKAMDGEENISNR